MCAYVHYVKSYRTYGFLNISLTNGPGAAQQIH